MEMPSDAKGLCGQKITAPTIDEVGNLITCITGLLGHLGRVTGRKPEAEGLIIALRETFGGQR